MITATPCICRTPQEFDAWDEFVSRFPGAHYSQLYGWLSSYKAMGFDCEVMAQYEGDQIVGGAAFLSIYIPVVSGRIFILPHGPLSEKPGSPLWQILMNALDEYFKEKRAIYVQAWPPVPLEDLMGLENFLTAGYQGPALFTSHNFSSTLLAIDLANHTEEEILANFRNNTRSHYRKSLSSGLEMRLGKSHEDLRKFYEILNENGRYQGYQPRPWKSFRIAFDHLIKRDRGLLIQAWKGDELVGTNLMLFAGRTATFYAGSTRREFNKFYPAEFMHVSSMFLAKKYKMEIYDLMNWVDEGVAQFKRGFRPRECRWAEPRTKIFKPKLARCLSWGEKVLRPAIRRLVRWKGKGLSS